MPRIGEIKPTTTPLMPFWQTTDGTTVRLYSGDVVSVLQRMQASSVHTVITSPPYWGLRDYGTAQWSGGKEGCDHVQMEEKRKAVSGTSKLGFPSDGGPRRISDDNQYFTESKKQQYKLVCGKCGAKRIDQQIGSEPSPDCGTQGKAQCGGCFICTMVKVFRAVKRVLRHDGTLWLNLGDSYASSGTADGVSNRSTLNGGKGVGNHEKIKQPLGRAPNGGLTVGNLVGVPWRVALALQADGWILRSDIPWVRRNPMPESCTNRPAKSLEYVFLLVKSNSYFFDMEAVKPQGKGGWSTADFLPDSIKDKQSNGKGSSATKASRSNRSTDKVDNGSPRNFRNGDLWYQSINEPFGMVGNGEELVGIDINPQGYEGAHYAVFGSKLITPMIKAATSEKGCCAKCGCPWVRVLSEATGGAMIHQWHPHENDQQTGNFKVKSSNGYKPGKTVGWQPSCTCNGRIIRQKVKVGEEEVEKWVYTPRIPLEDHEIVPCTVLDPFIGSGTTCAVSIELGRNSIGIDLNEKYLTNNAIVRVKGALLSRPMMAHLAGVKRVNVLDNKS